MVDQSYTATEQILGNPGDVIHTCHRSPHAPLGALRVADDGREGLGDVIAALAHPVAVSLHALTRRAFSVALLQEVPRVVPF